MAIKAVFVGINKHSDPAIPELSGARRDAMALWALFTDTIEELAARLLVDEQGGSEGCGSRPRNCLGVRGIPSTSD